MTQLAAHEKGFMDIKELNEHFGLDGVLAFRAAASGLIYADITTPHASATVYLQGAHLTAWQPAGEQPVIFLSRKTDLSPGKAIRGGVPISFPWFAARHDGQQGPSHGFARIQQWTLAFAALAGDDLHLTFTLGPTEMSRSLGYDHFRLAYQLIVGQKLTMQLTVANDAAVPLVFEEALHTYYVVADIREIAISGLDGVSYRDKVDGSKEKQQAGDITISGATDRVYLDTSATCTLHDSVGKRQVAIAKTGSDTTVVWNPWESGAAMLQDMDPTEWREFVAIETVNAATNSITLAPGATHTMRAQVTVASAGA